MASVKILGMATAYFMNPAPDAPHRDYWQIRVALTEPQSTSEWTITRPTSEIQPFVKAYGSRSTIEIPNEELSLDEDA